MLGCVGYAIVVQHRRNGWKLYVLAVAGDAVGFANHLGDGGLLSRRSKAERLDAVELYIHGSASLITSVSILS